MIHKFFHASNQQLSNFFCDKCRIDNKHSRHVLNFVTKEISVEAKFSASELKKY